MPGPSLCMKKNECTPSGGEGVKVQRVLTFFLKIILVTNFFGVCLIYLSNTTPAFKYCYILLLPELGKARTQWVLMHRGGGGTQILFCFNFSNPQKIIHILYLDLKKRP